MLVSVATHEAIADILVKWPFSKSHPPADYALQWSNKSCPVTGTYVGYL
jgi:hypothetical protein